MVLSCLNNAEKLKTKLRRFGALVSAAICTTIHHILQDIAVFIDLHEELDTAVSYSKKNRGVIDAICQISNIF